jgi:NADPH2:quinone reductase
VASVAMVGSGSPMTEPSRHVIVSQLGETPMQALESYVSLQPQPRPDAGALGPHEVLIAVRSCAVGWVDLLMMSGQYQHMPEPPYTPGLEYAGEVAAIGRAVTRCAVGDAAMIDPFVAGPRTSGAYRAGGFATWAVVPERAALPRPRGLDYDQACNLLGSYETAYHCLVARGRLAAGETVLIHGASGATGLAAVHVAKRLGATVIATGRSDAKLEVVRAQGADHVINSRAPEGERGVRSFRDEVKALTGGCGVDVVYDGVGGEVSTESLRCVRFGARYLVVGWAATPFVARGRGQRGAPNANVLPTNLIMMKGLDVLGCPTVIATQHDPSLREERLSTILRWVDEGTIVPHVSHRFALDDFAAAMRAKWAGDFVGGGVVRPGGE